MMSDNTMPERIFAGHGILGGGQQWFEAERVHFGYTTEYIRADVVAKQLAERDAKIISFQTRVTELQHDLNMVIDQRNAANARIAELEAALNDYRFVITELKTRLTEEGSDAVNRKLIEKEYELAATRSGLLERISVLLEERKWMSVSEGLPEMYNTVYVAVETPQGKRDIDFAFMTQSGWSYHLSPRNGVVTHWMPLPPPPVTP